MRPSSVLCPRTLACLTQVQVLAGSHAAEAEMGEGWEEASVWQSVVPETLASGSDEEMESPALLGQELA